MAYTGGEKRARLRGRVDVVREAIGILARD
jgi:hypothetical protein